MAFFSGARVDMLVHKQFEEDLHRQGAVNAKGKVYIDTDAVIFSAVMTTAVDSCW